MNDLLELKLDYDSYKRKPTPIHANLRADCSTSVIHVEKLERSLQETLDYYSIKGRITENYLIDVKYNDIIAKSRRIQELFKPDGSDINSVIVGARFSDDPEGNEKHIITYYLDSDTIKLAIKRLALTKKFLREKLNGEANKHNFNETKEHHDFIDYSDYESKDFIRKLVVDCSVIEYFSIPSVTTDQEKESILITFFKTEKTAIETLDKLGINRFKYIYTSYSRDTVSVSWSLFQLLSERIPYMISMISSDLSEREPESGYALTDSNSLIIPDPNNEPIIGVIDNLFDSNVYFSDWVENHDYLDEFETIGLNNPERVHGTEVSSIIVDGPQLNPWLDDDCGRFRVRHFGVCEKTISTTKLVMKIKKIVEDNPDIHVWNLSLGTEDEVSKNFISFDASVLDEIQAHKNVIFVISGTNDNRIVKEGRIRIGSPADSLNSVVVNSVKRNGAPASYSRKGNVLSFFNKPDVSYYGGDFEKNERINVCRADEIEAVYGTSFAAPWVSRKLAFLIDIIGLQKEVAKALIIDSSAGWGFKQNHYMQEIIGYGVVPIKISDVLSCGNDEIRFVLFGKSKSFSTSFDSIPIPKDSDLKYPFIARATMCYFPECERSQGVDYTSRELSLKFGRILENDQIDDINENTQDDVGSHNDERQSRKEFRKWENTKHISQVLTPRKKAIKSYGKRLWGISITSKERLASKMKEPINFGIVITLREIKGINRNPEFYNACSKRGIIINSINLEQKLELYYSNQEEIELNV